MIKHSLPACKSRHVQKMCDIHLSQLVLSKIVAIKFNQIVTVVSLLAVIVFTTILQIAVLLCGGFGRSTSQFMLTLKGILFTVGD